VWSDRLDHRVETRAARLCAELRDAIINTPDMDVGELFDSVYADITPALRDQRDQLMVELAKEA
jgi:pyruvate dehydrogenase E1 component alpha subunit